MKIKKLLIGTNNMGKLKEIRNLLPKYIKILSTSDFKLKSPKENGKTFVENSFAKPKLVFCHYRDEINSIHKILQPHIKNENLQVYIYDGRTTTEERNKILNASNQNAIIDVLLIQIQCGCEGLNLQYFKEIYFTSPHWNPAMEDQAIARCHRIGQTSDIQIFKFFMNPFNTQNTQPEDLSMDLRILEIQKNKKLHHI